MDLARAWTRFKSAAYTRIGWIQDLYVAVALRGQRRPDDPPLPASLAAVPLARARVALLTSAGVHLRSQPPFDMRDPDGDASFRPVPGDTVPGALTITHDYYDHRAADRDVNCVFPLERLREVAGEGDVGQVAPRHVSFMGHLLGAQRDRLIGVTATQILQLFRDDGVDVVVASPG